MNEELFLTTIIALFITVTILITIMLHTLRYRMTRIYNWNGSRYCYLGYTPIRRERDSFTVHIGAHMLDLSRTTAYQICPDKAFCRKNRYRDMFVYADKSRSYLVIDTEPMKTEVPF